MLRDGADTHTPTVYLWAISMALFSYTELHYGLQGFTLVMLNSHTHCLTGLCVYLSVYSNTHQAADWNWCLTRSVKEEGVCEGKTWISGVHCECICVRSCMPAGTQNVAVFTLCALLREQLKSLNSEGVGEGWRLKSQRC